MNPYAKLLQRRLFSFLNTGFGCGIVVIGVFMTINALIHAGSSECGFSPLGFFGGNKECWRDPFKDNIGGVNVRASLAYDPIDVVYTWVNGSDPIWIQKMKFWKERMQEQEAADVAAIDVTDGNSTANETSAEEGDSHSLNRYRDSNELKFSLRSLQLYAPWIHKVYIVTDNQVPNWLDTSHPRIQMVSHADIFDNASHLPVFSSPAIEAHLHKIPGLTKKFIYFNDDVMLGRSVLPEDFTTVSGVQKFTFAWDVPKCAPGCSDNWIGDGYCDRACNVSSCNFDFPDCVNATVTTGRNTRHDGNKVNTAMCAKGCPETWVADKTCDTKCKNAACGWDIGDCGLDIMEEMLPHVDLSLNDVSFSMSNGKIARNETSGDSESDNGNTVMMADVLPGTASGDKQSPSEAGTPSDKPTPLVMTVVNGTTAVYFNLSFLPCQARFDQTIPCKQNFTYTSASYSAEEGLVHQSILLNKHDILGVLLFHGQDGAPNHPGFPQDVEFAVSGTNAVTDMTVEIKFRLQIVENDAGREKKLKYAGVPAALHPVTGRCNACPETAEMEDFVYAHGSPVVKSVLHAQPFLSYQNPLQGIARTVDECHVGAVISMTLNPHILDRVQYEDLSSSAGSSVQIGDELMGNIFVRQSLTSPGMPFLQSVLPLCSVLGKTVVGAEGDEQVGWFHAMYPEMSRGRADCYGTSLREFVNSAANQESLRSIKAEPKHSNVLYSIGPKKAEEDSSVEETTNSLLLMIYLPKNFTQQNSNLDSLLPRNETASNGTVHYRSDQRWFQSKVEFFRFHGAIDDSAMKNKKKKVTEAEYYSPAALNLLRMLEPKELHSSHELVASSSSKNVPTLKGFRFACVLSNIKWKFDPVVVEDAEVILSSELINTTDDGENTASVGRRLLSLESKKVVRAVVISDDEPIAAKSKGKSSSGPQKKGKPGDFSVFGKKKQFLPRDKFQSGPSKSTGGSAGVMRSVLMEYLSAGHRLMNSGSADNPTLGAKSGFSLFVENTMASALAVFGKILSALGASVGENDVSQKRRLTTDTYGQSLIYVNRLYHKTFGSENRKVPAHVPHMIDSEVMAEMQDMFKEEWESTSAHKFRSPKDMQYAFSYYYYLMNRNKAKPPSLLEYISREVDTNHDGFLDKNEFLTLASLAAGRSPKNTEIENYYDCAFRRGNYSNLTHSYNETGVRFLRPDAKDVSEDEKLIRKKIGAAAIRKIEKVVQDRKEKGISANSAPESGISVSKVETPGGVYEQTLAVNRFPSVEDVLGCPMLATELRDRVAWPSTYTTGLEKDVAFEMIGDNFTDSYSQLNSIRARRPKFICINDNMKDPSEELMTAFADFFSAMYPFPSCFELPEGEINPYLHTDELLRFKKSALSQVYSLLCGAVSDLLSGIFLMKSFVVSMLRLLLSIVDGGDDSSGLYILLRRVIGANAAARSPSSASYLSGWVTSHDHGYDVNRAGDVVHTVSMSLPFSFLVVNVLIAALILWIYRATQRRRVAVQPSNIRASTAKLDEVAKLDGVTAPKLAVAASVEKPATSSSKFSRMGRLPNEGSEDFLNKLWRSAGYNTGGGEEQKKDAEQIAEAWEDSERFLGGGFNDSKRHDSSDSHESISSIGMGDMAENSGGDSPGYEHGILKKEGSDSSVARRNKTVRFTKVEGEARPRVTSLPGRLISGLFSAAGRGLTNKDSTEVVKPKKDGIHED